jgi:hypothetical protein
LLSRREQVRLVHPDGWQHLFVLQRAWTMHTLVTDDCVSFICNTIGTDKSYTIRFPRANLFKNEDFSNVAACFHDKATLALSTMLTGFALCDVGGDFTVNYNN